MWVALTDRNAACDAAHSRPLADRENQASPPLPTLVDSIADDWLAFLQPTPPKFHTHKHVKSK